MKIRYTCRLQLLTLVPQFTPLPNIEPSTFLRHSALPPCDVSMCVWCENIEVCCNLTYQNGTFAQNRVVVCTNNAVDSLFVILLTNTTIYLQAISSEHRNKQPVPPTTRHSIPC